MPPVPPMLERHLAREQRAFLRRDRGPWTAHLEAVRAFLGEGLSRADRARPVLILGAGSGLEVPWRLAPPGTHGWDADPWSRTRTFLRHGRWAPWCFEDATGALGPLVDLLRRNRRRDWRGRPLGKTAVARARIAGLLPDLPVEPLALRTWLRDHRPGTVLAANLMGQFGAVATVLVEQAFGIAPWEEDPDRPDPLAEALDRWTARVVRRFLETLRESGADLWLVHDRAVLEREVPLGPWHPDWQRQVLGEGTARDPLAGVDVLQVLASPPERGARWCWPVGPGQIHLVEALRFSAGAGASSAGSPGP